MKLSIEAVQNAKHSETELVLFVIPVKQKNKESDFKIPSDLHALDAELAGALKKILTQNRFGGENNAHLYFPSGTLNNKFAFYCVSFTSDLSGNNADSLRKLGGRLLKLGKGHPCSAATFYPFGVLSNADDLRYLCEGMHSAAYEFTPYKSDRKDKGALDVKVVSDLKPKESKRALFSAEALSKAINFARDQINEPASELTTRELAKRVSKYADSVNVECRILEKKELADERMNLMLAVGQAASEANAPRLIELHYRSGKKNCKHITLVGKGVMFDSGGLDLKPSPSMILMKKDMSGAATMAATLFALAELEVPFDVSAYLGCVENCIDALAYRPGDVIKSKKGLFVEITNTDAEGRLVLADVLSYAQTQKSDLFIDLATLTGASMIALGTRCAAYFSNSDKFVKAFEEAALVSGERFWRMPLNPDLEDQLKSDIADIANASSGRYGGCISAALFLQKFVEHNNSWMHLDIAGPSYADASTDYLPKGALGFSLRTLVNFLISTQSE